MHKFLALAAILSVAAPTVAGSAFFGSSDATNDVAWLYESPLTVYEDITYMGSGIYWYTYTFENVDTVGIWMLGIWTTFAVVTMPSTWTGHPTWELEGGQIQFVFDAYDGRNLDPDIVYITGTYDPDFDDATTPILPGETVTGFTIAAYVEDHSQKWYFYETVESGYAGETGFVAAVGLTQGPPVGVESATLSGVKALFD